MLTLRPKLPKCIDAYEYSSGNAATVRNVEAKGLSLRSTILPALYFATLTSDLRKQLSFLRTDMCGSDVG